MTKSASLVPFAAMGWWRRATRRCLERGYATCYILLRALITPCMPALCVVCRALLTLSEIKTPSPLRTSTRRRVTRPVYDSLAVRYVFTYLFLVTIILLQVVRYTDEFDHLDAAFPPNWTPEVSIVSPIGTNALDISALNRREVGGRYQLTLNSTRKVYLITPEDSYALSV
eukprot:1193192-Prorocentrum_minimum.AAC.1